MLNLRKEKVNSVFWPAATPFLSSRRMHLPAGLFCLLSNADMLGCSLSLYGIVSDVNSFRSWIDMLSAGFSLLMMKKDAAPYD